MKNMISAGEKERKIICGMKQFRKKELLGILAKLIDFNQNFMEAGKTDSAVFLKTLIQCQESAVQMGTYLETLDKNCGELVKILENYCENLYRISLEGSDQSLCRKLSKKIRKQLMELKNGIRCIVPADKKEIVFLPYKASMWDSLESIWKAAAADENAEVYVIPIPYYDRNFDGSLREEYYEGDQFPADVPITDYKEYNLEDRKPEVIFIHNPYDQYNFVTSVHPDFYSVRIKQFTENLIYVPYYVLHGAAENGLVLTAGVFAADQVIVQSERVRKAYLQILKEAKWHKPDENLENKIIALGTPKTDKMINFEKRGVRIPADWERKTANKKIIFMNTNVSLLLRNAENFEINMERIFAVFDAFQDSFAVIWREHPLTESTIMAMRPNLMKPYHKIREDFEAASWGILDNQPEPHLAMALSDGYYGAGGSLVPVYSVTGKPMMLTAYQYPDGFSTKEISLGELLKMPPSKPYLEERNANSLALFLTHFSYIEGLREQRLQIAAKNTDNLDGTVGEKIYDRICSQIRSQRV